MSRIRARYLVDPRVYLLRVIPTCIRGLLRNKSQNEHKRTTILPVQGEEVRTGDLFTKDVTSLYLSHTILTPFPSLFVIYVRNRRGLKFEIKTRDQDLCVI